jgi:hypothetical protein
MEPVQRTLEQDEFLALVCADEDLLRTEFEAIIDACWEPRPPATATRLLWWPERPGPPRAQRPRGTPRPAPRRRGDRWARQRSPPRSIVSTRPGTAERW